MVMARADGSRCRPEAVVVQSNSCGKAMPERARTRPITLDANLFMRHGVRRFLCAAQESAGSWIVVPTSA